MAKPQVLKNHMLFVDGQFYAGRVEEVNPPKMAIKMEAFREGGMDIAIGLDMGMEGPLEASYTMVEYNADLEAKFGRIAGADTLFVIRGAMQRQGEDAKPIAHFMRGRYKETDPGAWKSGEKTTMKHTISLSYYRKEIDGRVVCEIDVMNMVRNINGFDEMLSQRAALGI